MDLINRGARHNPQHSPESTDGEGTNHNTSSKLSGKVKKVKGGRWTAIALIVLLFSVTIVLVGLAIQIFLADASKEEEYIDNSKMQAVFLNSGQVYFGDITELNTEYLNMSNIYYLRVNRQIQPGQQATQNDVSLVKLGCELHGPQDRMTINREQVTFWENLKDDGQVVKAVAEYVKQNPNGQNCEQQKQQQSNTNSSNSNSTNNSNNNTSSENP